MLWLNDQRGQVILEFALILPALLLLFVGSFLVGFWMNSQMVVNNAARAAARVGALTNNDEKIKEIAQTQMRVLDKNWTSVLGQNVLIDPDKGAKDITDPAKPDLKLRRLGKELKVTVKYDLPFVSLFSLPEPFNFNLPEVFRKVVSTILVIIECDPGPSSGNC
jgi:uncharacterized protein (UPF0333 family)